MKVRAKQIAKELEISEATVSLVLNHKPGVSEKTRKKVFMAMKEYGFSSIGMTVRDKNKNGNIRFIAYKKNRVSLAGTPFFSELVEGIDREARNCGYHLGLTYIDEEIDDVKGVLRMIKEEKPDGLLLLATEMEEQDLINFKEMQIPMLILDNYFEDEAINMVCIDNMEGAYKVGKYLVHLNHSKIGYLHSTTKINNFSSRMKGIKKVLRKNGIEIAPEHLFLIEEGEESAYDNFIKIMKSNSVPTAIFADNDMIACGAIRKMKENGIRVPQDVSVIGFDDMPICELMEPKLTTVHVHTQRVGSIAMGRLAEIIEEFPCEIIKSFVGTELVIRESTKRMPDH